ncbi:hypothetical protein BESB_022170 [Besnoitia besnoiti]|uniref:Uncharacterized protein n=1 Tax=Besnoitia besnoiti TaxID=94643 RepID=A0A2A9M167_BESBE|nr:hypothetical protein BESB_022170 [Besnoitia besnoiti]PFH31725.1 hypothetical protein BESB_022170 [Besnoitia besnoiti]
MSAKRLHIVARRGCRSPLRVCLFEEEREGPICSTSSLPGKLKSRQRAATFGALVRATSTGHRQPAALLPPPHGSSNVRILFAVLAKEGSERKNGHWCPFDELLGGVAALNDLRQAVLEKQARRLRELSAYYQKCQHLSEENNYLKCRQRALARQLKEVEEASRAQRDAELKKMSALNTHLLHDNMVLHTSLASLINGQPTVVAGLFEEDTIFWEVPNFALLLQGRTCTRVVSPWLKSEKRRNCRVRFLLYPFGTRQDRLAQATGKNSCEPPACGTQCPSLFVRMKGDVEATFYLFYGRRCTSPVTYKFSESLGGGRSFYRHDFCSSWRDDLRHLGEEPFYVGLSLLQCCQRSQYLIRHHDHHSADLNRRSLRLG